MSTQIMSPTLFVSSPPSCLLDSLQPSLLSLPLVSLYSLSSLHLVFACFSRRPLESPRTWQRAAQIGVCVRTHAWRQTWIYCFYSREGPLVIGSSPRLMSSRLRCLFFAPQHKRIFFLERLNESKKKNLGVGGGGCDDEPGTHVLTLMLI